ncbi:MAG TPA: MMPL family transporter [Candidatus Nitrosopolaris sp.]|nr:MMPL family transporter [Candidatus Nitrosopolaris sp.]
MFASWGRFVFRYRWATLVGSGVLLAISIVGLLMGGTLTSGGPLTSNLESARAGNLVTSELAASKVTSNFVLLFSSKTETVGDGAFKDAVTAALAPIEGDSRISSIVTPYNAPNARVAQAFTSTDGHQALVSVDLKSSGTQAHKDYDALRKLVHSDTLTVTGTGFVAINEAFNKTLESDLQRAETVTLPVTLVLLVIIFASLVAAGLPLGVGILTIVGGLAGTFFLNRFTDVSQYALNIVTLIGLGVSIDYSLFVVNRFRDELARGASREDALATTMATAGRAITFSGVTVAVGLSAMLFFQGTFLASMGAAGAIVVAVAVVYALTFLPALMSVLGPAVNRLRMPLFRSHRPAGSGVRPEPASPGRAPLGGSPPSNEMGVGFWGRWANWVMRRPLVVLLPATGFLLLAASPFIQLRLANGDVDMLPSHLEARQGYDQMVANFPGQDQTTFNIVVNYPDGSPLTTSRIGDQYDFERRVAAIPGVLHTTSIYDLDSSLGRTDYQALYTGDPSNVPPAARQLMAATVGKHIVLIQASTASPATSDASRVIVKAIRADGGVGDGAQVLVGGQTAIDLDVIKFIVDRTPLAVGFVVAVTLVVLFLLTGSVVLPVKAVLLNFLSIGASFGALVWIFQQGHLSNILGFTPQSIDPSIPVILFSIVFGLSMDYEVLLVSRIHEEYVRTGDNTRAVASGLERTARLITGAAAIMFTVFMAFGLAEVVIIKAIGIGLAVAVAIDATLVRALVVPAVMRLLGDWNWWAPRPLRKLYDRAGLGDFKVEPIPEPELEVA